ncbi:MAG: Alternative complex III subunit ActE [Candidatus Kapaibacterium sp.]|nr:MAG: Alternative complex III subunit ActE [Candidatus Kapabacteria bacterium]
MKKLFDFFYDEINFKEVFKDPKRLIGYSFIVFFLAIFGIGLVYLNQIDQFYRNETPYDEPDPAKLFKDVELTLGRKVEGVKVELIKQPTEEMLKRGEEIYKTTCSTCHGEKGQGDGIAGKGLNPPPRNFAEKDGWKNGRSITQVYKTLQEGIPGSGMVAYEYLSPSEKIALYHIIKKFGTDFPDITDKDVAELDATYKVTQTYDIPPTIPIGTAVQKIVSENDTLSKVSANIVKLLNDPEIKNYVSDPELFAGFLLKVSGKGSDLENLLVSNYPLNGVSAKFIKSNSVEKKRFIEKLLSYKF